MGLYIMQKITTIFFLFIAFSSYGQVEIESQDIANFIGKEVKVKAKVAGIFDKGAMVIAFNMVENYPKQVFQAIIYKDKAELFGDLKRFEGKEVTLNGKVSLYPKVLEKDGKRKQYFQIILNNAKQIELIN